MGNNKLNISRLIDGINSMGIFMSVSGGYLRGYCFLYIDLNKETLDKLFKCQEFLNTTPDIYELSVSFSKMYLVADSKINHSYVKKLKETQIEWVCNGSDGFEFLHFDNFLVVEECKIIVDKYSVSASCYCPETEEFICTSIINSKELLKIYNKN